jgi:hypothetical protein
MDGPFGREDGEGIFAKGEKNSPKFITPFLVNAALLVGQGPQFFRL